MDNTKLYLCFEATNTNAESVYLIYSAKVGDLMANAPTSIPKFNFENSISGASSMGCGLFNSKIVLAGGVSGAGEETIYNRGLVTYDTVSKEVSLEDFTDMRGRKVRPLVFELYGRLYVLDTSNSVYKRTCEVYYPSIQIWEKVHDPFCNRYNALSGNKNVIGRTPYSWFINGKTVSISLPTARFTYIHHAREIPKCFTVDDTQPLPFEGMATTYWEPGFRDVVVISFSQGGVGGQGRVDGRRLRYSPVYFFKPQLIFQTDAYEKPDGEVSSYLPNVKTILRHKDVAGASSLVLDKLFKHKYTFNDFSLEGITSVSSISGCFVLPRDDETKRSAESNLYNTFFSSYESESGLKDDDLPILIKTAEGLKIDPEYDSSSDEEYVNSTACCL
ncbi:hypothetical protein OROGR_002456 [Orobanche gracilis]